MKKNLSALLALLVVSVVFGAIALIGPTGAIVNLYAQQPSDASVTRPDHIVSAGDVGTCNEGDTEYSLLVHAGKRCTAQNTWASVVTAPILDASLLSNTVTGISAQRVCHVTYNFAVDGGATPIVPAGNCVIPINAVITNAGIQATTGVTAAGAATVAVGCVGGTGCGSSALMAATGKASLGAAAFGQSIPVPQTASTWVKTTAAGGVTLTIASGPLTAGLIEIYVYYVVSSS